MARDALDEQILRILKKDSRTSNVQIAQSVGLTEGAVRHRIKNLVADGTIRNFTVGLASADEVFAVVMVKAKGGTKKMLAQVMATGLPQDAYEISGEYDACIIISGKSIGEIDLAIDRIRACGTVADTKTFMSLRRWQV